MPGGLDPGFVVAGTAGSTRCAPWPTAAMPPADPAAPTVAERWATCSRRTWAG